jgi:hypothetical protein
MILSLPTYKLRIRLNDALGILDGIMKEKHWRKFDVASIKLVYEPYWLFNYDVYLEMKDQVKGTVSQTFGARMALNGVTGDLAPEIVRVIESQPVETEKQISHSIEFDVEKLSIKEEEIKNVAKVKIAGQVGIGKEGVVVSGLRAIYLPVWRVFASIKGKGTYRIDIDGLMGLPYNYQQVPERERGVLEITQETLEELKNPAAWGKYAKKAIGMVEKKGKGESQSIIQKIGLEKIVLGAIAIVIFIILVLTS